MAAGHFGVRSLETAFGAVERQHRQLTPAHWDLPCTLVRCRINSIYVSQHACGCGRGRFHVDSHGWLWAGLLAVLESDAVFFRIAREAKRGSDCIAQFLPSAHGLPHP